jgi:hypothetical protein
MRIPLGRRNNGGDELSNPAIEVGDKLHITTRRLFENDVRRHSAGEVTGIAGELQELRGYAFVFEAGVTEYKKRPELGSRLPRSPRVASFVTKIPRVIAIASLQFRVGATHLVVTDGNSFTLDINEPAT